MAESLNFTYTLELSRDGKWGNYIEDIGQWNGIIKDILDDAADVGFAPLTVLYTRSKVVDFLLPLYSDKGTFIISRKSSINNGFITTFKTDTWNVIMVIVVVCALVLTLVVKLSKERRASEFRLAHCLVLCYGAFCGFGSKGWHTTPVTISAR